jgi:spermidine/putrescine transport system ATP-binding protein
VADPIVRLRGVSKRYDAVAAVEPLDLDIDAGDFIVLLGPSGSGKTTILSIIGGFLAPTAGRVFIGGEDVTGLPPARRPTATVFQDYALFPHMSVRTNVAFGLAMRGMPKALRERRADEMLALVGLEGFGDRSVHQLSGGQQQRVALARAIAVEPKVLLLDEPLGALDLALRRQMQQELVRIQKRLGTSFVHVTHDQEEAMGIADRIVVMNKGRIEDTGPPARVYLRPATRFTATFMGESNILPGEVVEATSGVSLVRTRLGTLAVPAQAAIGEAVSLSIRPEQLMTGGPGEGVLTLGSGRIAEVTFQGTHLRAQVSTAAGETLLLRTAATSGLTPGDTVELAVRAADIVLLREHPEDRNP